MCATFQWSPVKNRYRLREWYKINFAHATCFKLTNFLTLVTVNLSLLKCRPSQLDHNPSWMNLKEEDDAWKSSSLLSDSYDDIGLTPISRRYDNRYNHRRQHFVSSSRRCISP